MKLYLGQSALRLTVKTFCNLRDVEKAAIRYRKSDGVMGEFPAVIRDEEGGVLCYECGAGDINRAGWWSLQVASQPRRSSFSRTDGKP